MPHFVKLQNLLRHLLHSRHGDSDLNDELHAHVQLLTDQNLRAGMSTEEAQRAARIELGGIEQVKEQVREQRLGNWLHSVASDCRFALRQLRKNPGFTAIAVLTLALGIAMNATMFSLVSAFLLRRPPGREPERVAVVTCVSPVQDFQSDAYPVSPANYLAWRGANHSFAAMAAADESRTINIASQGQSEALRSAAVSTNYFSVLGVSPELGRTFADGEDQPGR